MRSSPISRIAASAVRSHELMRAPVRTATRTTTMNMLMQTASMAGALLWLIAAPIAAQPPKGMQAGQPPAMPVVLAPVQQQELREQLWFSGTVLSRRQADIATENAGRITTVPEIGDYFRQGESIVLLDDTLLQQDLAEQEAESASHHANIRFLAREVERLNRLLRNDYAAQSQLEQMHASLESTKALYAAGQARVARTLELIRRMEVVAPFDGIISARYAEAGEWLSAGDKLVELTNPVDLEIATAVPAHILPQLAAGDILAVEINGQTRTAILRTIVPVADSMSRLFELRLDSSMPGSGYVQQMVRVAVPVSSPRNSLVVPEDALVIRNTGISVMIMTGDRTVRRVPVQVGMSTSDGLIEVRSDTLQRGDQVIVRGAERIREGMPIRQLDAAPGDTASSQSR